MGFPEFDGEEIQNRMTYHAPSEEGILRHAELSIAFAACMSIVVAICPPGREQSLALTKIEEAKFWASAAVARNKETV